MGVPSSPKKHYKGNRIAALTLANALAQHDELDQDHRNWLADILKCICNLEKRTTCKSRGKARGFETRLPGDRDEKEPCAWLAAPHRNGIGSPHFSVFSPATAFR